MRKPTRLPAAIWIGSPVWGLRPTRGLAVLHFEGAEAGDRHRFLLAEPFEDAAQHGLDQPRSSQSGGAQLFGHVGDELALVHREGSARCARPSSGACRAASSSWPSWPPCDDHPCASRPYGLSVLSSLPLEVSYGPESGTGTLRGALLTTSSPSSAHEPLGFPCLFGKLHGMSSARARSRAPRTAVRACRQHARGDERERSSAVVDTPCTTRRARGDVNWRCTPNSLITKRLRCAARVSGGSARAARAARRGVRQDAACTRTRVRPRRSGAFARSRTPGAVGDESSQIRAAPAVDAPTRGATRRPPIYGSAPRAKRAPPSSGVDEGGVLECGSRRLTPPAPCPA